MRQPTFLAAFVAIGSIVSCGPRVELDYAKRAQKVHEACRETHPNEPDRCANERAEANRRWTAYQDQVDRQRQEAPGQKLWP